MPRLRFRALALCLAAAIIPIVALAVPAANQCVSFADLINNQSAGGYTWKGSAPPSSAKIVSWADFQTYVNTQTCSVTNASYMMTWGDVLACASTHTVSQQSQTFSGNYTTTSYSAQFNATTQIYICKGPYGSDAYTGTPINLPSGTAAPTSASTQLALSMSSIHWYGSTSLTVTLYNPSGVQVGGPWTVSSPTSTLSETYSAAGAPAGAWSWHIAQAGGSDGTCDPGTGAQGGGEQVQWSGTATFYE